MQDKELLLALLECEYRGRCDRDADEARAVRGEATPSAGSASATCRTTSRSFTRSNPRRPPRSWRSSPTASTPSCSVGARPRTSIRAARARRKACARRSEVVRRSEREDAAGDPYASPRRTSSSTRRVRSRARAFRCTTRARASCREFPRRSARSSTAATKAPTRARCRSCRAASTWAAPACCRSAATTARCSLSFRARRPTWQVAARMGLHGLLFLPVQAEPVVEVPGRHRWQDHDGRSRAARAGAEDGREVGRVLRAARAQSAAWHADQDVRLQGPALQHLRRTFQEARRVSAAPDAAAPDRRVPLRTTRPTSCRSQCGTASPPGPRRGKLEEGFEEGASIQIKLSTGETVPAEVRVFKAVPAATRTPTIRKPDCAR